jgi:NAD(P)-dependent dehydrogenase (short-subunit alcohol dehydrogenase family)
MQEKTMPPQHQDRQPGSSRDMHPQPEYDTPAYTGSGKLSGRRALITGGDSGIGRSVAILFAKEGADVAIVYHDQDQDAEDAKRDVEAQGRTAVLIKGDVADPAFCAQAVDRTVRELGGLDVLVNNAAQQFLVEKIEDIPTDQIDKTFRVNIFSMFYLARAAVPHMKPGSAMVNTTSITAYQGNPALVDYSATKGAIVAFTRALAMQLVGRGIRVNGVAPGPIWTPLIPASFPEEKVASFGKDTPMKRPGQPREVAPAYVFLASEIDSSYLTGQVIHVDGGNFRTS